MQLPAHSREEVHTSLVTGSKLTPIALLSVPFPSAPFESFQGPWGLPPLHFAWAFPLGSTDPLTAQTGGPWLELRANG